jgi:peptidoglycan hydrolase-like protein with peptidoglycan-binding domain
MTTPPPTISQGATGAIVKWAQYLLVRRTLSDNQIDGVFGPVTTAAVEQFQRDSHLAIDGIVGPATWAALKGRADLWWKSFRPR